LTLDAWFPSGNLPAEVNAKEDQFALSRVRSISPRRGGKQIPVSDIRMPVMDGRTTLATYAATLPTLADGYAIGQRESHLAAFPKLIESIERSSS